MWALPPGWCRTSAGVSYWEALAVVLAWLPAAALWLHTAGKLVGPGAARLAAAAPLQPVVALNLLLPRLFCGLHAAVPGTVDIQSLTLAVFNIGWLASFKAISWACGRGALVAQRFTLPQFLAVYALPITPLLKADDSSHGGGGAGGGSGGGGNGTASGGGIPRRGSRGRLLDDAGDSRRLWRASVAKNALLAAVLGVLRYELPGMLESLSLGLALYVLLSFIMDVPAAMVVGWAGLRVSPHFDQPWRSTSVASFWSQRWDLAAGNTLRQLVFDPVVEGCLVAPPPGAPPPAAAPGALRPALGTLASFSVSGLVHECIFWFLTGHASGGAGRALGPWFFFFSIQAPIIIAERAALAALKRQGIQVPMLLRRAITVVLVLSTAEHWFWAPTKRYGIAQEAVASTKRELLNVAFTLRAWLRL